MIRRLRLLRAMRKSDDGAMLIFALIVVTTVALVTGALLTTSGAKFAATVQLRKVAGAGYAADAAAKVAISDLQYGSGLGTKPAGPDVSLPTDFISASRPSWVFDNNVDQTGCFGATGTADHPIPRTTVTLPGFYKDNQSGLTQTATVTCAPVVGTGVFDSGPANPIAGGAPNGGSGGGGAGRAVTILGSATPALDLKVLGSGNSNQFAIHGDIAVQGQLAINNGNLYTNGAVVAGSCNSVASVIADSGKNCSSAAAVGDPHASRTPNAIPTDSNGNWRLGTWSGCTFQPGYYDDAVALTAATAGCAPAVFTPGTYYFDFHNNVQDPTRGQSTMSTTGGDVWKVNGSLVGGVSTGGPVPGSCVNPIDSPSANGVQFIFGGDSQMVPNGGSIEICASSNATQAPIAVFGLDGSTAERGKVSSGYATPASTPTMVPGTATTTKRSNGGSQVDDWTATPSGSLVAALGASGGAQATYSDGNANSANSPNPPTLTMGGFTLPAGTIPPGSNIQSATLKVKHDERVTGNGSSIAPSLKVTLGSSNQSFTTTSGITAGTASHADSLDLTALLADAVHSGSTFSNLSVAFSEAAKGNATANVDAVSLVITYFTPKLRGETSLAIPGNCVERLTCNVIDDGNGSNFKGEFVVQGVTYLPGAGLNLALGNQTGTVSLRWGLVAMYAHMDSRNSFPFAYPVVSIPNQGPAFGRANTAVDLKVFLCSGSGPCSTTGTPALTSRVMLTDPVDSVTGLLAPKPGERKVQVLSWSEQK